jgi:hypothetical protein
MFTLAATASPITIISWFIDQRVAESIPYSFANAGIDK